MCSILHNEKLARLIKYYNIVKKLLLEAEEEDINLVTIPQIINELRNSYDHLIRSLQVEINLVSSPEDIPNYMAMQLDKAYAHVLRAGYDTLDWLNISYREKLYKSSSHTLWR